MNIQTNISSLEDKIQRLSDLKTCCENINMQPGEMVGDGGSIRALHALGDESVNIKTAILELLTNSISFFENIKSSMEKADQEAANKIRQEAAANQPPIKMNGGNAVYETRLF